MRISDWSSDVCSSDLPPINVVHAARRPRTKARPSPIRGAADQAVLDRIEMQVIQVPREIIGIADHVIEISALPEPPVLHARQPRSQRALEASDQHRDIGRSEEHTSELQSLMRISYAVFCLKKKIKQNNKVKQKT